MALLLNIDTATEVASVCITDKGSALAFIKNENQKEHASFVHTAIADLLKKTGIKLSDFEAFAVTSGPGSYTGLRVGMAAAKGFCYALSKPLITINTLEVMAKAAIDANISYDKDFLYCPMIDARRMEVFGAIYNADLESVLAPQPVILNEQFFDIFMKNNKILFFGSGSIKLKQIQSNANGIFSAVQSDARALGKLADGIWYKRKFADILHAEPTYLKDFHSITKG